MKRTWILLLIVVSVLTPIAARSDSYRDIPPSQFKDLVEGQIWANYPLLKHICSCESWGDPNKMPRQMRDGVLLRGDVDPDDVGACQINVATWGPTATKLGLDIYAPSGAGNIEMAEWIATNDPRHYANWNASKRTCWAPYAS
jgi:hypothetical protein